MQIKKFLNQVATPGFTLTELMAVVIIVAILAAVAAGSYKKAIERSHFSEGLTAAHTVLSGVERYYMESCNEGSCVKKPKIADLDVSLSNSKACATPEDHCVKIKYFEITVKNNGNVTARRSNGMYSINVYPESMGNKTADECTGNKDFCVSVGYTKNCTADSSKCIK